MKESASTPDRAAPIADPRRIALNSLSDLTVEEFGQVLHRIVRDDNSIPLIRELVTATTIALSGISGLVHHTTNGHSSAVVAEFGELLAHTHAGTVVMTAEAFERGEIADSQKPNATAWVRDHSRYFRAAGAGSTAKAATILLRPELQPLADRIRTSAVPPAIAVAITTEFDKLVDSLDDKYLAVMDNPAVLDPDSDTEDDAAQTDGPGDTDELADGDRPAGEAAGSNPQPALTVRDLVLERFCRIGQSGGIRDVKNLRDHLLVQYGSAGAFQDDHEAKRKYVELSAGLLVNGIWRYDLTLDPESRADIEAAINQLSKPFPQNPETGEIDLRSQAQRRGQALVEVCRRAVTAARDIPTSPKSYLHVMVGLDDLVNRTGYGTTIGTVTDGEKLPIDTIRKMACNAGIIPTVMASDSSVLDLGQPVRYFTPAQARALWIRDGHCSFPGCTTPATWSENHHLVHAADGGGSDLENGALLCGRDHTIVHRDKLAGRVVDGTVIWDLRPGSYYELLAEFRAGNGAKASTTRKAGKAGRTGKAARHSQAGNAGKASSASKANSAGKASSTGKATESRAADRIAETQSQDADHGSTNSNSDSDSDTDTDTTDVSPRTSDGSARRSTAPRSGPETRPAGRSRPGRTSTAQQRRPSTKPAAAQDKRPEQSSVRRT